MFAGCLLVSCLCCVCSQRREQGRDYAETTVRQRLGTVRSGLLREHKCHKASCTVMCCAGVFGIARGSFRATCRRKTATCVRFGLSMLLGAACVDFGVKSLCCDNVYRRSTRQRCPTTCLPRCCCTAVDFRGCMPSCWIRPGIQGGC